MLRFLLPSPDTGIIAGIQVEGFMTREKAIEAIRTATTGNRLTCEKAHALSQELNMPLREIGILCNELKIKISSCQLGCF
jgi:hypothetical protein